MNSAEIALLSMADTELVGSNSSSSGQDDGTSDEDGSTLCEGCTDCDQGGDEDCEVDDDDDLFQSLSEALERDNTREVIWPIARPLSGLSTISSGAACVSAASSPTSSSASMEDQIDPCFQPFHDYFDLNTLVRSLAHQYCPASPSEEDRGHVDGLTMMTAVRRGSLSSTCSESNLFDFYGDAFGEHESPPYSPSTVPPLQDYFSEYDRGMPGSGRRDSVVRRGKVGPARTYAGQQQARSVCVFCRNNGEAESLYASHALKDSNGKVTCPILRAYTCPVCKAHGDTAHTLKYCPKNDSPAARQAQAAAAVRGGRSTGSGSSAQAPGLMRRRDKLPSSSMNLPASFIMGTM